jgi:peptidoglycan hydrolase CwlO-like protein
MSRRLVHLLVALSLAAVLATPASADLQSRVDSARGREKALLGSIHSDTVRIQGFQGRLDDLLQRLAGIQASLDSERNELLQIQGDLRSSRAHLAVVRAQLKQDMEALSAQLVANYESPPPDAVTVVFSSHGFSDLLDRVEGLRRIEDRNVAAIKAVKDERVQVTRETNHLRVLAQRQQRITAATLVQRNQVAQLKNAVLSHVLHFKRARDKKASALGSIRSQRQALEKRLNKLIGASGFDAHGGEFGFFPAPGTDYGYGDEPTIAGRLDKMCRALHIHCIGLSGHRTPEHSVEVGGFPNDPHTRGEASDTPGVEGVSESTLNQYGLTRPFGGAAEADHIQLAGSSK